MANLIHSHIFPGHLFQIFNLKKITVNLVDIYSLFIKTSLFLLKLLDQVPKIILGCAVKSCDKHKVLVCAAYQIYIVNLVNIFQIFRNGSSLVASVEGMIGPQQKSWHPSPTSTEWLVSWKRRTSGGWPLIWRRTCSGRTPSACLRFDLDSSTGVVVCEAKKQWKTFCISRFTNSIYCIYVKKNTLAMRREWKGDFYRNEATRNCVRWGKGVGSVADPDHFDSDPDLVCSQFQYLYIFFFLQT